MSIHPRLEKLKYSSVKPLVFTEQGVAMLSSVLTTERAVQINVSIMRAFAHYRNMLLENEGLRKEIKKLDQKMNKGFKYVLDQIEELSPQKILLDLDNPRKIIKSYFMVNPQDTK